MSASHDILGSVASWENGIVYASPDALEKAGFKKDWSTTQRSDFWTGDFAARRDNESWSKPLGDSSGTRVTVESFNKRISVHVGTEQLSSSCRLDSQGRISGKMAGDEESMSWHLDKDDATPVVEKFTDGPVRYRKSVEGSELTFVGDSVIRRRRRRDGTTTINKQGELPTLARPTPQHEIDSLPLNAFSSEYPLASKLDSYRQDIEQSFPPHDLGYREPPKKPFFRRLTGLAAH